MDSHLKDELAYVRGRVDEMAETLVKNTVILEANTESLREHMRRTDLLEKQMETALIPIKVGKLLGYIIGLLGTAVGGILGLYQLFK